MPCNLCVRSANKYVVSFSKIVLANVLLQKGNVKFRTVALDCIMFFRCLCSSIVSRVFPFSVKEILSAATMLLPRRKYPTKNFKCYFIVFHFFVIFFLCFTFLPSRVRAQTQLRSVCRNQQTDSNRNL